MQLYEGAIDYYGNQMKDSKIKIITFFSDIRQCCIGDNTTRYHQIIAFEAHLYINASKIMLLYVSGCTLNQ